MGSLSRLVRIASIAAALSVGDGDPPGTLAQAAVLGFAATEPPAMLPPLEPRDADDRPTTLDSFKGKPLLLNIWATWCGPCVQELPSLQRLATEMPGLTVVALSVDRGGFYQVGPFLQQNGLGSLRVLVDKTSATMKGLGLKGLPVTLLIDREGREVGRVTGEMVWDSAPTKALLIKMLAIDIAASQ